MWRGYLHSTPLNLPGIEVFPFEEKDEEASLSKDKTLFLKEKKKSGKDQAVLMQSSQKSDEL